MTALRYVLLLLGGLASTCGPAQDVRSSQLYASPLTSNPALTGVMRGSLRATINYQQLYATLSGTAGLGSAAVAVEGRLPIGQQNAMGIGFQVQQDRAYTTDYIRSQATVQLSYQQGIGNGQFLSAGVQAGVGQRGYDINKLWFSNQYFVDPATRAAYVDQRLPTGEPFGGSASQLYADVSAGLAYFAQFGDRRGVYGGVAAYHLSQPNVSPLPDRTDELYRRYVGFAGGELPLGRDEMSFLPSVRVQQQGPLFSTLVGGAVRYTEQRWREVALRAGVWTQWTNQLEQTIGLGTLVTLFGLEYEDFLATVSYDIAVGAAQPITASRGGYEISIIYVRPNKQRYRVECPTF